MNNVVGQVKFRDRLVKVTRDIAKKQGWEVADQRLNRTLRGMPVWQAFVRKALENKNEPASP